MALANVAWILASQGKRVLALDWDLEAPGLHRYFAPFLSDPSFSETEGLIEFLSQYIIAATKEAPKGTAGDEKWYVSYADVRRHAEPLTWRFAGNGSVEMVGAGRQNTSYGARVNGFDWDGFYRKFGGGAFLDEAIRQMKEAYDYILVDSRTGISDTSGICTIHLPDALVVFYTLNNQSVEGASNVAAHVAATRAQRSSEPFPVFAMASRVELAEKEKLEARRSLARERFGPFLETLPDIAGFARGDYWGDMEILYDPYYAYEEVLATIGDSPGRTNSVLAAFERLTARLTNGEVSRLGEFSEARRQEALAFYAVKAHGPTDAPRIAPPRKQESWDIFISASEQDRAEAERLYYLLEPSFKVFYAPRVIQAGSDWELAVKAAVEHSRTMVVIFSGRSAPEPQTRPPGLPGVGPSSRSELEWARERAFRDPDFRLIPVPLDSGAVPPADFMTKLQWLHAQDGNMQNVAVQVRDLLGESRPAVNDEQRTAYLRAELNQAVVEKTKLTALAEQLQRERMETSVERGVLTERTYVLEQRWRQTRTLAASLAALLSLLVLVGTWWYLQRAPEGAPSPVVRSFDVNPPEIPPGGSATLTWKVEGPGTVTLRPDVAVVAQQGTQIVRPATTTTYTLSITEGAISSVATRTVAVKVATMLHVSVAVNPPVVAPGDRALIRVAVTDQGRAVPGAAVVIHAGGGAFADSASRMGGQAPGNAVSASGQTGNDGVSSVEWRCVRCAPGYVMTATASKEGVAPASTDFQVRVRATPAR